METVSDFILWGSKITADGDCSHEIKSFSISPSNEYSGLVSFTIDWFDLLAVQETHKNLLQHYSSKTSIIRRSAFFTVQLSHPYTTTGETIAVTRQIFSVSSILDSEQTARGFLSCLLCYPLTRLDLGRSTLGKCIVNEH